MDPITVVCPRGLGDAVICLPVCYALRERGHRVNLRNAGSVQFAEHFPALVPIGTEREGEVRDCGGGLNWHSSLRMLAQVSLRYGVFPLAIPGGPWLRRLPEYSAMCADLGVPEDFVLVAPQGFSNNRRLEPWQLEPIAEQYPLVCVHDKPLPDMPGLNLTGKTTLPQLFALLSCARAAVCVDSGPLHTAGAFGTPVLACIGCTLNPYSFCEDYTPSLWVQHEMDSYMIAPQAILSGLSRLIEETGA